MLFVVGVGLLSGANDPHLSVGWKLFWALAGGLLLMFVPALIIDSATKAAVARLRQEMPVPIEPGPGMVAEYVVRRPSEPVTLPALDPTFGPQRDTPDGEAP